MIPGYVKEVALALLYRGLHPRDMEEIGSLEGSATPLAISSKTLLGFRAYALAHLRTILLYFIKSNYRCKLTS